MKKRPQEEIQRILWHYDKGASIRNLSQSFHISKVNLKKLLLEHGLVMEEKLQKELYVSDPVEGRICKGKSYKEYLKENFYKN